MMDEGRTGDIEAKPNKDEAHIKLPVDQGAFNEYMMAQRKFHAEALRSIENYLWENRLITRRLALAARER